MASHDPASAPDAAEKATVDARPSSTEPQDTPAPTAVPATAAAAEAAAEKPAPLHELWTYAQTFDHPEVWGVVLADPATHVPSQIVLQKYLNANDGDLAKAKDQLGKTLTWRKETQPLELLKRAFDPAKFGGVGYVTTYDATLEATEVVTWNIYGGVTNLDATFGKLDEFLAWRVALMELALQELALASATAPITADTDPYKITQVHDYKGISFFRQSAVVKAASTETIKVFAQNYPELLKEKFFVNVPAVMGFVYGIIKVFVAPKTLKKFHPMSDGGALAKEFAAEGLGEQLPREYGGAGGDLKAVGKEPALEAAEK